MKICIVGGVAGGAGVAARLRRHDENHTIIMFEKGEHISYANCGLPYYIGDVITDEEELYLQTPETFHDRFNVDVRVLNEIVSVDTTNKQLHVRNLKNGESYVESYDVLVLSPGAKPMVFPLPGIDLPHIFTLRNVRDTLTIKSFIKKNRVKKAVVIGGGYIGLEMAENLHKLNIKTTIVEAASHVVNTLDDDMASILHNEIRKHGVGLYLNSKAVAFNQHHVVLDSGEQITADMVLLSIGVSPETGFLDDSGIALGPRKEILTDAQGKTNIEDVYALGDAVAVRHIVSNNSMIIPLASPANKQARIVADAIAGKNSFYKGSQGTAIAQVFDKVVAVTGENDRSLRMQNRPFLMSVSVSNHHASYYPGAEQMIIKCYFTPDEGMLLGAQIVGAQGVDKRIDTLAIAIRYGMKVTDLQDFELAYAPPFGSAKDPVNMAGYVAENVLTGKTRQILPKELMHSSAMKLDVRDEDEVEEGTIANSIHIPLPQLRARMNELNKNQTYIIYCAVGLRGYLAEQILRQYGYDVVNAAGGYTFYNEYLSSYTNK
jgi:NADPH-dependent 2,4-dienoyl-CoA reductase/sulfur reductase-like enzyme/rhodanese-related sulfurtransferase